MVNKQKIKGTQWENLFVDLINSKIKGAKAKRIPSSGAMGTFLQEPLLMGDVVIEFSGHPKKFRVETKVGYGGDTQLTIKKEWLDKIKGEADNTYSIPMLACKFLGARKSDGIQYFVTLDLDTFCDLMNYLNELKRELDLNYDESMGFDKD